MQLPEFIQYVDMGFKTVITILLIVLGSQVHDMKDDIAALRDDFVASLISAPGGRIKRKKGE